MPQNQLLFYCQNPNQKNEPFLFHQVIQTRAQSELEQGLYLLKTQFSKTFQKKLEFDFENLTTREISAVFIYKPLNETEFLNLLKALKLNIHLEIYILAHKLYQFEEIIFKLIHSGLSSQNVILLTNSTSIDHPFLFHSLQIKKYFSKLNSIQILPLIMSENTKKAERQRSEFILPFVVVHFLKVILTPTLEIKKAFDQMQQVQFVWLKRLYELISFFLFIIYSSFHHLVRVKDFIKRNTLVIYYKTYGLSFDLFYFLKYLVTWILPYPIFKTYWFLKFQFNKRIKSK